MTTLKGAGYRYGISKKIIFCDLGGSINKIIRDKFGLSQNALLYVPQRSVRLTYNICSHVIITKFNFATIKLEIYISAYLFQKETGRIGKIHLLFTPIL